uniref:Uncharacterized protein n=1 Tax=Arundo donax TaxID=35708 RepID=A0A0A8YB83_ARUDO
MSNIEPKRNKSEVSLFSMLRAHTIHWC